MSKKQNDCMGKNCAASAENGYAHSSECLADYELAINTSAKTTPQSMQAALQIIAEKDARIAELDGHLLIERNDYETLMLDAGRLASELAALKAREPIAPST